MNNTNSEKEKLLDFMSTHEIYPNCSKKGKIYLTCFEKEFLTREKSKEILQKLDLKTEEECKKLREEIKTLSANRRTNKPINKWVKEERPREMAIKIGMENLPLGKLFAIILRTGRKGVSAEEVARDLINNFGSLRKIYSAPLSELCKIKGIGKAKAIQIKAALEIGRRFFKELAEAKQKLKNPDDVVNYVSEYYGIYLRDKEKEFFYVILLDIKNKPIDNIEISKGGTNSTVVDPKEIVKYASLKSASSVILVHNHPSGETTPSQDDLQLTDCIVRSCNLIGIKVIDHIIVGKNSNDYYSFAKNGKIKNE